MAVGRVWYGAKYSYGVWERFARQGNNFEKVNFSSICQIQHFVIFGTIYQVIIQEVHDIKYTLGLYLSG